MLRIVVEVGGTSEIAQGLKEKLAQQAERLTKMVNALVQELTETKAEIAKSSGRRPPAEKMSFLKD